MERVRRRWWTTGVSLLAALVVAGAVLSGLFQVAVMTLPGYRDQLSAYISRVAGRPIEIGGIALVWQGFQPQFELSDIVVYSDDGESPALSATRLRIGFGLWRLVRGETFPSDVEVSGLELAVEIDRQNRVRLRGMDTVGRAGTEHDWRRDLSRFDSIRLQDCMVLIDDARLTGSVPRFHLLDAEARRRRNGASLSLSLDLPGFMGRSAEFKARIKGDLQRMETWQGRWNLSLDQLVRLPWLEARLPGHPRLQFEGADLAVSGTVDQGRIDGVDLDLRAASVAARRDARQARVQDLLVSATARRKAGSWALDVSRLGLTGASGPWPTTRLHLQWTPAAAGPGGELQADTDFLRLQDLAPWLMLGSDPSLARLTGVSGELRNLVARGRLGGDTPTYSLRAQLDGLGLAATPTAPGFAGLRGELSATESGGRLGLSAQPFRLDDAQIFAAPVVFDRLEGQLEWTHSGDGWRVLLPSFAWSLSGSKGQGDLDLLLPAAPEISPEIKLAARFTAGDALRLKPYVPVKWGEPLRHWMDSAIVAGRVPQGRLRLEGPLRSFPFRDGDGVFELDVDVADAQLAFAPDWPAAEQMAARLQFRAGALTIVGASGQIAGNSIQRLVARIPDFKDAVLDLDGEVDGEAAGYYDFLRASPLAPRLAGLLTRTQVTGPASVHIKLALPLKDVQHPQLQGVARLEGVELRYKGIDEPFTNLQGDVAFTGDSASAEQVTGNFYGVPAITALKPEGKGNLRLVADLDYTLQSDGARLSRYLPAFLRPYMSGTSHWRTDLVIGPASDGVRINTDLRGVAVNLPAPVGKAAEEPLPLTVRIGGGKPDVGAPVQTPDPAAVDAGAQPLRIGVAYGQRLGADILLAGAGGNLQTQRVLVNLGSGAQPQALLPGVRVTGSVAELDAGAWIAALRRGSEAGTDPAALARPEGVSSKGATDGLRLQAIDLHADRLYLQGYGIGGAQLAWRPRGSNGDWVTTLAGDDAQGTLDWENRPTNQLIARLNTLSISPRPRDPIQAEETVKPAAAVLDPAKLPILDLDIGHFRVGEADLGHLRVLTERIDAGQRLSKLQTGGADLTLKASGEWLRRAGASSASFSFAADSRTIGEMLEGFGYVRNLSAQRSKFTGDLSWAPSAGGLDWTQVRGTTDLDLERGTLRAVEPGAGRVLGLLNFYALPRRLTLDFRDVVSKGLGFDHLKGRFETADGNARTDDLLIESPSLKIELRGRIGLAARDYDQHVKVYPDVSGGVTLGALLLGGPAGGLIALIAQEVLDKPLEQVTQLSYQVTGSWDNPQVKRAE